ncbi:MAG: ShlB/FhaC/HecB family hemolysin secretion/activation protein [Myxococcota bacterium]
MAVRSVRSGRCAEPGRLFLAVSLFGLAATVGAIAAWAEGSGPVVPPPRIEPSGFTLEGCTVFSPEQQAELFAPYRGRALATSDLLDLVDAVRARYAAAGYGAAEVWLPDQDLPDGRIRIGVDEGRVEAIEIRGATAHWPAWYRARLARATRAPLHLPTLYGALERLQAEPAIERIAAVLERTGPGRERLTVEVEERSPWSAQARASNHRSPAVGSPGGLFSLAHASVTGFGDRFTVQGQVSEGIRDFALRWDAPLVVTSTRALFAYRRGRADVVEGDAVDASVDGRYEAITLGLRQPLFWRPDLEVTFELLGDWRRGGSRLLGVYYCFLPGLEDCTPTVAALRASQELVYRGRTRAAFARSTASFGLDVLGATPENGAQSGRDGEFVSWLLQLQWLEGLPPIARAPALDGLQLAARFDLQLADDPLVPVEQFAVGGGSSVRGYRENQLVRDNGFVAALELRVPILRSRLAEPVASLAPFVDVGRGWDRRSGDSKDATIASAGLALRFALTEALRAEVSWAHRFRDIEPKASGLQGEGLYFEVVWDVF